MIAHKACGGLGVQFPLPENLNHFSVRFGTSREGGSPICQWISSVIRPGPFFSTDLTPNDPLFYSVHTQWLLFFYFCIKFYYTNCKFWGIYQFYGNFSIKLANFGLKLHFLHTEWQGVHNKKHPISLVPSMNDPFLKNSYTKCPLPSFSSRGKLGNGEWQGMANSAISYRRVKVIKWFHPRMLTPPMARVNTN